ncbi:MAG: PHP domain-containing protein [Oscillospiraceae bacterium]|jgi:hypothetical protein|nr:PHP domain-containing protein [Oscillospiraceae bacterium]
MKHLKKGVKLLSILLAIVVFAGAASVSSFAALGEKHYVITNPYANVDWETWNAYKTQLHVHTNASDGSVPVAQVVEDHYALDFDILALTDHMTLNRGWTVVPQTVPIMRFVKRDRTKMAPIIPVTEERYQEIINGVGRDGRGMIDITTGVELNGAVPSNSHVNGYFAEYGQGLIGVDGDFETPVRENGKLGGITFLDHLGNYTRTLIDNDPSLSDSPKHINKFTNIFLNYGSCVGMDINSGQDTHTQYDRKLYDNILQKTIPYGVVPWSFTFSDAHDLGQWDRAFTVHMMTEQTQTDLRRSMEEGTFFSVSRYARAELGQDFLGEGAVPAVTSISVDAQENTITLTGENYDNIVWVADGKEIATGATIDINDYEDDVTCYVRAYLTGPGGICYVQPFTVIEEGVVLEKEVIPPTNDRSTSLRNLVTFLDDFFFSWNPLIRLFKKYALGL